MEILKISGVDKSYPGQKMAVNNLSLSAKEGEVLALVGESGCGKTTLLRLIAGFEQPEAGQIELDKRIITGPHTFIPPEKRGIGLLFQDYALFPHLSVGDNVQFGLNGWAQGQKKERVSEMLVLCGIEQYAHRFPHELSGGQQQRAALARALAPRPGLLLLDEPFSNIDTLVKEQVRTDLLHLFKQSGVTAIFVTHDLSDAFAIADRVAVMKAGELEQIDSPTGIYQRPNTPYVAHFFGRCNLLQAKTTDQGFDTPLGLIKAERSLSSGESVLLVYRPKDLTFGDVGVSARVESIHYQGHTFEVGVRIGVHSYWVSDANGASRKKGDLVKVEVNKKPAHVLPVIG